MLKSLSAGHTVFIKIVVSKSDSGAPPPLQSFESREAHDPMPLSPTSMSVDQSLQSHVSFTNWTVCNEVQ